jgi:branched-chain amino acid transport system permease protein
MRICAGASDRDMAGALGIDTRLLFTLVFGLGAVLAGLAGMMAAPIVSVQSGMGEEILILTFVVIVIGGIGSIRGAFLAAILIGVIDTMGRAFLPQLLEAVLERDAAHTAGSTIAAMLTYLLMAVVLFIRPQGLFPPRSR